MLCPNCGHNHKHNFLEPVALSFCGAALDTKPVRRCTCISTAGVEVQPREEATVIPEGYSLTESIAAFYLRNRYKNNKNQSVVELLRYPKDRFEERYTVEIF
jgi:hypothetical protein